MKKTSLFLSLIMLLIVSLVLSACVSNAPSSPPVTVTATQTQTQTQTLTVTPSPLVITLEPSAPPTTYSVTVPAPEISQVNDNNTPRFFIGQDISGYTKKVNSDGSITQTPVYKDLFMDLQMGQFFTQKDALFLADIPGIMDQDRWILKINIRLLPKLPVILNWGYTTKNQKPDSSFTLTIWSQDDFKQKLNTNPPLLNGKGIAINDMTSEEGIRLQHMELGGYLVAFVKVNDADNIESWWLKYAGSK